MAIRPLTEQELAGIEASNKKLQAATPAPKAAVVASEPEAAAPVEETAAAAEATPATKAPFKKKGG